MTGDSIASRGPRDIPSIEDGIICFMEALLRECSSTSISRGVKRIEPAKRRGVSLRGLFAASNAGADLQNRILEMEQARSLRAL